MKIIFGTQLFEAQMVMTLLIPVSDDKKMIDKILNWQPVTRITEYVVNVATDLGAVQIWDRFNLVQTILGEWELSKTTGRKNYYKFTPKFEAGKLVYEFEGQNPDDYYGVYILKNYKKL